MKFFGPMLAMPGKSFSGPLPPLTSAQAQLRDSLHADVTMLAQTIGERNIHSRPAALAEAAQWIEDRFQSLGLKVTRQSYDVGGIKCDNIEATIPGVPGASGANQAGEIIVVGAHYDSVDGCPGANDNGTGVAGLLAIAKALSGAVGKPQRTLRFVAFVNEEPPFFQTDAMGSVVYARACKARGDKIAGMISLETIGYYSDAPESQYFPSPFGRIYPSTGNFIGFVGNWASRKLVHDSIASFRQHAQFPSEGGAVPELLRESGFSDHHSFWQQGYPGLMVTDTAMFRYPHYHTAGDTPDRIDYDRTARVVEGLAKVVEERAG